MELKEGMYIRYIPTLGEYTQKINKIIKMKNCLLDMCYTLDDKEEVFSSHFDEVLGASYNIIDLIEVGDYVNGSKVEQIDFGLNDDRVQVVTTECYVGQENFEYDVITANEIKSIVTKEQFSQMEYKVGD